MSIYTAYPLYFWVFINPELWLLYNNFVKQALLDKVNDGWWKKGLVILLIINCILFLIPVFRGYVVYGRADVLTNIGYARDILDTGHFSAPSSRENFYPAFHIIAACISSFTNLNLEFTVSLLVPLFIIFYFLSMYLLSRKIGRTLRQSLLITAFGSLPLFTGLHVLFHPINMVFFLLPFTVLLFQSPYVSKKLFCLMLIATVFFHPIEGVIFIAVILMCLGISSQLHTIFYKLPKAKDGLNYIHVILILLISDILWSFAFAVLNRHISDFLRNVFSFSTATISSQYFNLLQTTHASIYSTFQYVLNMYGPILIYFVIAFFFTILSLKGVLVKHYISQNRLTYSITFTVLAALSITFFLLPIGSFDFSRGLLYGTFASAILIGLGMGESMDDLPHRTKLRVFVNRKLLTFLTISVLFVVMVFGVLNEFYSPAVRQANEQVTHSELQGMTWFLENQRADLFTINLVVTQFRYANEILGVASTPTNIRGGGNPSDYQPPDHFGYNDNRTLGQFYNNDVYFVDTSLSEQIYPLVYPEFESLWRFTHSDFQRLNVDNTVDFVYGNGYFTIRYVHAEQH
jgi:hypothetical protein